MLKSRSKLLYWRLAAKNQQRAGEISDVRITDFILVKALAKKQVNNYIIR